MIYARRWTARANRAATKHLDLIRVDALAAHARSVIAARKYCTVERNAQAVQPCDMLANVGNASGGDIPIEQHHRLPCGARVLLAGAPPGCVASPLVLRQ
jgi:hypothetical protein